MQISIIAAVGRNYEIGKDNHLLWRLDGDLPFFKRVTSGKSVIMGRRTFESLPSALVDRKNIVLSRSAGFSAAGASVVRDKKEALEAVEGDEVFIIGGESIYRLFLEQADRIYLTEAEAEDGSADAFFPVFDKSEWKKSIIDAGGGEIKYIHALYEKNKKK